MMWVGGQWHIYTFWRPGYLNFALLRASKQVARWFSLDRMDIITCPMCTRATVPCGLPNAPRIPVWSLYTHTHTHTRFIPRHHYDIIPVSPGTRQHLVDPEDVKGVEPHPNMELVLPCEFHHVLVAADAAGLQRLAGQLLVLIGDQVDADREGVNGHLLGAKVKDPYFGVCGG